MAIRRSGQVKFRLALNVAFSYYVLCIYINGLDQLTLGRLMARKAV